jgi:hypothetical protein
MLGYLQERFGQSDGQQQLHATFCDSPEKLSHRARAEGLSSLGNGAVEDPVCGVYSGLCSSSPTSNIHRYRPRRGQKVIRTDALLSSQLTGQDLTRWTIQTADSHISCAAAVRAHLEASPHPLHTARTVQ